MSGGGVFVCGFGDLAAGIGGLAWNLAGRGALLLRDGEVQEGAFALEQAGEAVTLAIEVAGGSVEATLSPKTVLDLDIGGEGVSGLSVTVSNAEVHSKGDSRSERCPGQICRWNGGPCDVSTVRLAAIDVDGALLTAIALGGPGPVPHGEERASAWLVRDQESVSFDETLISTQYDGAGHPTRFGLELWPGDAPPTRTAGSLIGGVESGGLWAGLFRCHSDGTGGLGSYALWRR